MLGQKAGYYCFCRANIEAVFEMIGRLNHVAIAVPDLDQGIQVYASTLGAKVSEPQSLPEHGVTVVFVELPNTKIELLHPLGEDSPISAFLDKNCLLYTSPSPRDA